MISRAMSVLTSPKPAMERAAGEATTTSKLVGGYAAILAALPAIALLVGTVLLAGSMIRVIIVSLLITALLMYLLRDLGVAILIGLGLAALAPNFGGRKDSVGAMKLAVYAGTPIWIAAFIMTLLGLLVPALGGILYLLLLLGFAFAGYIRYVGASPLLGVPQAQAPVIAAIGTIAWIVLYFVAEQLIARIFIGTMFGGYGVM